MASVVDGVDFTGASLYGVDFTGTDLRKTTGLTERQLEGVSGLADELLPKSLRHRGKSWF